MKPQTRWNIFISLVALLLVSVIAWAGYSLVTPRVVQTPQQAQEQDLRERWEAQEARNYVGVDIVCAQLKENPKAVECKTNVPGIFFWDFKNEKGEWQTVYYNERPALATGFLFTNSPEEIRVQFRDLLGNTAEYYLTIKDERPAA